MKQGTVLIVEDNPSEQLLIKTAFEEIGVTGGVQTADDGDVALAYLKGAGQFANRDLYPFPTFLLTDLKMPRMNGFELLLRMKRSHLIVIPTVVYSTSDDPDDIKWAYQLGANAYHVKPMDMDKLCGQLKRVYEYWINCTLPTIDKHGNLLPTSGAGKLHEKMRHPVSLEPQDD